MGSSEREQFEAELAKMPDWAPEFEPHRAWVNAYAWNVWQAARRAQASAEPCAWEVRRLDPVEGPSIWPHAHRVDIEGYRRRPELYELRPLYAAPQQAPLTLPAMPDLRYHAEYRRGFAACLSDVERALTAHGISAGKEKTNHD